MNCATHLNPKAVSDKVLRKTSRIPKRLKAHLNKTHFYLSFIWSGVVVLNQKLEDVNLNNRVNRRKRHFATMQNLTTNKMK